MATWSRVANSTDVIVSSGNITLSLPAGTQAGDLLVAGVSYRDNKPFSAPVGTSWVIAEQASNGNTSIFSNIGSGFVAWMIRGASAPSTTFTRTGGNVAIGVIEAYRDLDGGVISLVDSSIYEAPSATSSVGTGALTSTTSNNLVIPIFCGADDISANRFFATDPPTQSSGITAFSGAFPNLDKFFLTKYAATTTGADAGIMMGSAVKTSIGSTGTIIGVCGGNDRHVMAAMMFESYIPVTSVIIGG